MKNRNLTVAPIVALLAVIMLLARVSNAQQSNAQNPLPRGAKFAITGEVQRPTVASSGPKILTSSSLLQTPMADKYGLPIIEPKGYNEPAIEASLNALFNWAPASTKYSLYFQLMPWAIDIRSEASALLTMPHDTEYVLKHWTLTKTDIGIKTMIPSSISSLPPFQSPDDAIFVKLDGFGYPVPISVAQLVEANFIDGFVTRLVLNAYQTIYAQDGYGHANLNLSIGDVDPTKGYSNAFATATTYTTPPGQSLKDYIASQLQSQPINSIAILYGWKAADELVKEDDQNHTLQKAVWSLLNYRHSFRNIGKITGYTLNYLNGFALNENIAAGGSIGTIKQLDALIAKIEADQKIVQAKQFLSSFKSVMIAEFYAVSQNTNKELTKDQRTLLLTQYSNFIDGFTQGTQKAADVIYNEVADLSFGLGYAEGFKDGYALGYTTGWADGYAAGNATAWVQANQIIQGLQQQVASLQNQLNNSGGGGFWDTVGNIASGIGTAIGIIGSLF